MDKTNERVSVKEAAEILGMPIEAVRVHMYKNQFKPPIGHVTNPSGSKRKYLIYKNMLNEYMAIHNRSSMCTDEEETKVSLEEKIGSLILQAIKEAMETS